MAEVLWDENAEAAYQEALEDGVWLVVYWPNGKELETHVFSSEIGAKAKALQCANEIWDRFVEDDWPTKPETWDEVLAEVLNHAGHCWDVLTLECKEIE